MWGPVTVTKDTQNPEEEEEEMEDQQDNRGSLSGRKSVPTLGPQPVTPLRDITVAPVAPRDRREMIMTQGHVTTHQGHVGIQDTEINIPVMAEEEEVVRT